MSTIRGYSNYSGRRPKGRGLLAALLILVILAALFVLLLQRYVVYDENGAARLDLPWQQEETAEDPEPLPPLGNVEIVIQMPEADVTEPQAARWDVLELPAPLTRELWMQANAQAEADYEDGLDAVVVTLKDETGAVYFDSAAALIDTTSLTPDTAAVLEAVTSGEFCTVARISCFLDPRNASHYVTDRGLRSINGYIFYDGNNRQWMDPGKPKAREFLCDIAKEIAALGFDEVLLTEIGYPTEGRLEQIAYTPGDRSGYIVTFLQEMRMALQPYGVRICAELPEIVIREGREEASGLVLAAVAQQVDGIYTRAPAEQAGELAAAVAAADPQVSLVILPPVEPEVVPEP